MCKMYDAIYEVRKHTKSDLLHLWLDGAYVKGTLTCSCFGEEKPLDGIITLKDVVVECSEHHHKNEYKWLNIQAKKIKAFVFDCCMR